MKKILLGVLSLIVFNFSGVAQSVSFTTQKGDTAKESFHKMGEDIDVHNSVINKTSSPIVLTWKIVARDVSNGWEWKGFCDNFLCYADSDLLAGVTTETSDAYAPTTPGTFKAIFNGDNALHSSSAWLTVEATDVANSYSRQVTYVVSKGSLGITSVVNNDDDVVLYPNPAKAHVNVIFNSALGVKNIAIYNLIGKAVSVYKVNGNSAKLDLTDIPSGIYFVRLINSQGKIVATRKITHQ